MKTLDKARVIGVTNENYKVILIGLLGKKKVPTICIAKRTLVWECGGEIVEHGAGRFYGEINLQKEELVGAEQAEYFAKDGSSRAWVTTLNGEKLVIELRISNLSFLLVF